MKKKWLLESCSLLLIACLFVACDEQVEEKMDEATTEIAPDKYELLKQNLFVAGGDEPIHSTAVSINFGVKPSPNAMACGPGAGICDMSTGDSTATSDILSTGNMGYLLLKVSTSNIRENQEFIDLLNTTASQSNDGGFMQFTNPYNFNTSTLGTGLGAARGVEISSQNPIFVSRGITTDIYNLNFIGSVENNKAEFSFMDGTGWLRSKMSVRPYSSRGTNPGYSIFNINEDSASGDLNIYMNVNNVYRIDSNLREVFETNSDGIVRDGTYQIPEDFVFSDSATAASLSVPLNWRISANTDFYCAGYNDGWFSITFTVRERRQ